MQNKTKENVNQTLGRLVHGDDDGENDAPNVPFVVDVPALLKKEKEKC